MELLISEVQKKSVLWNKYDKKYKDRFIADKEWNIVAKRTNMDSKYINNLYFKYIISILSISILIL